MATTATHSRQGPGVTGDTAGRRLVIALAITLGILVVEVAGGIVSGSLALLSDAGHVLIDGMALALALWALRQSHRPPNERMTFGYGRIGILAALVNAMTLVAIAMLLLFEATERLRRPVDVEGELTLAVAAVGLLGNVVALRVLRSDQQPSLNIRAAVWHVTGDLLASFAVIVSAGLIVLSGRDWIDPLVSLFIGVIIVVSSYRIIRDSVGIFMEATPAGLDMRALVSSMKRVVGVRDVHDLHVWSISPKVYALSCHVLMDERSITEGSRILEQVNRVLALDYSIGHSTVQMETDACDPNALYCGLSPEPQGVASHSHHAPC